MQKIGQKIAEKIVKKNIEELFLDILMHMIKIFICTLKLHPQFSMSTKNMEKIVQKNEKTIVKKFGGKLQNLCVRKNRGKNSRKIVQQIMENFVQHYFDNLFLNFFAIFCTIFHNVFR